MKVLVCVKQVPGTNKVEIDPETGVLKRDGVSSKLNPYDLYSLETGFRLVEEYGGEVQTLTMGPAQAQAAIKETLSMGASSGTVISDRKFAGADVLATSYTLAQVGPELAEHLGIPHVTNVLEIRAAAGELLVKAMRDGLVVEQTVTTPCLLCVEDGINTPRLPSYRRQKKITEDQIQILSLNDMEDKNEKAYGLSGSPTQVVRMFPPQKRDGKEVFDGPEEDSARSIYELLLERKMIAGKA